MSIDESVQIAYSAWEPITESFFQWLGDKESLLNPGLAAEPTIKVLIFLALLEADKAYTYDEIRETFRKKNVIKGNIPDNTLRSSVLSLSKTLDKFSHSLTLKSSRGRFQLIERSDKIKPEIAINDQDPVVLLLHPPAIKAEEVAITLMEKGVLSFSGLYFLEWSARWWEIYSSKEAEIRVSYEVGAWEKLGIKNRISNFSCSDEIIGIVGLAPGEGLAEIGLLKKVLGENKQKIHYLAIDTSPKLLRDHIGLLKEILTPEIESGRLICSGVVADIFTGLREALDRVRLVFKNRGSEFLPLSCSMLVTYFGNCLGNNYQDQETEFFSMVYSIFQNRPLEVLVGVSVMRDTSDKYIRNWDDFLLQAPKHLLETKKLLKSHRKESSQEIPEFTLNQNANKNNRCPVVKPEPYFVRHQIKGQIYRFYYKLAFDLDLAENLDRPSTLPKGSLILLHSITKYNMKTLVEGIKRCGLFKVEYLSNYHQVVETPNGKREYAVFSAFVEK